MEDSKKFQRASNFSATDKFLLGNLVDSFKLIIENKTTDSSTVKVNDLIVNCCEF